MDDKQQQEYRALIVAADQKAQEDYDKTVIALSGGALGISFAFVTDIVGDKTALIHSWTLFGAWIAWAFSLTAVLASFYFSQQALRKTIEQIDTGEIDEQAPGGRFSGVTSFLNAAGGVLFFGGLILMIIFVWYNFGVTYE